MSSIFSLALLFLYYVYFFYNGDRVVDRPAGPEPVPPPIPKYLVRSPNRHTLEFLQDDRPVWRVDLDRHYRSVDGRVASVDPCHDRPDGSRIEARGRDLYSNLRSVEADAASSSIVHVERTMPRGNQFYFECAGGRIGALRSCPVGELFRDGACRPIERCTLKPDGFSLPDAYDKRYFYECVDQKSEKRACPTDTFFFGDSCRTKDDILPRCSRNPNGSFRIDDESFVGCRDGVARVYKCPPGTVLVGESECATNTCVGRPDGAKVAMPLETTGAFRYSPGYFVCRGERIESAFRCPINLDKNETRGDYASLLLPQVFDGNECADAEFCVNVEPAEPDAIVPVYEFTRHVRNWIKSSWVDTTVGYACEGEKRKRTAVEYGHVIGKRFKSEPACDGTIDRVFLGDRFDGYYDCATRSVVPCPPDRFFDGSDCRSRHPHAHRFRGVDVFRFRGLGADGWIRPWVYSDEPKAQCTVPESVYLDGFNACAHPECAPYPFLKQVNFKIHLPDGSHCSYDGSVVRKSKPDPLVRVKFWQQRRIPLYRDGVVTDDLCTEGAKVDSGNFVKDSTLYATCNHAQPFVFCPSADTAGIENHEGIWACKPPDPVRAVLQPNRKIQFVKHELQSIEPIGSAPVGITSAGAKTLLTRRHDFNGRPVGLVSEAEINLEYKFRMTHPPNVAYKGDRVLRYGSPFVLSGNIGSTKRPLAFADYKTVDSVPDFVYE